MFETSPVHAHGYFCLQCMTKLEFYFYFLLALLCILTSYYSTIKN